MHCESVCSADFIHTKLNKFQPNLKIPVKIIFAQKGFPEIF